MKIIRVELDPAKLDEGAVAAVPVAVDWFPPLTGQQRIENAAAQGRNKPLPHDPEPNLIYIEIIWHRAKEKEMIDV